MFVVQGIDDADARGVLQLLYVVLHILAKTCQCKC
jgi:hypothetical protein